MLVEFDTDFLMFNLLVLQPNLSVSLKIQS